VKNDLKEIKPEAIKDNPFCAIGQEWMLITAGDKLKFNMMTASWGGWGVLWHRPICFCVVRPGRYTYEFMEKATHFTFSYFGKKYKKALEFCGTKSGRDVDKVKATGLTPAEDKKGCMYFKEARLVIMLKKIYFQQIDPERFLDPKINENYPKKDYHRMYVGEVIKCLARGILALLVVFSFNHFAFSQESGSKDSAPATQRVAMEQAIKKDANLMESIKELAQDPQVLDALADPQIKDALMRQDIEYLKNNEKFLRVIENPTIQKLVESASALAANQTKE
jgi:flavin reductase (DIM6/NTAB) family NADH-FMN oxidoreductase RutF